MKVKAIILSLVLSVSLSGVLFAQSSQAPNPTQKATQRTIQQDDIYQQDTTPIYRVTVVARNIKAVNYRHRSGSTKVDFRGTALLPNAKGEAKVESKQGVLKIDAKMDKLEPATKYGPEYLTYVMWAITPEGRAINVGEVLLDDDESKLSATVELQAFGLIVTAEPYYAVTQPSDVVVMENFIRQDTKGNREEVDAKYELLQRGQYTLNVNPMAIKPVRFSDDIPLEFYQAENAVQIASWAGAEKYAPETFEKALRSLEQAKKYLANKSGKKPVAAMSREAVQTAEDARIITIKRIEAEQLANERAAAAEREAQAKAEAEAKEQQARLEAERRALAETERLAAERAKMEAERAKMEAELAAKHAAQQKAEAERAKNEALAQQQATLAEAERLRLQAQEAERLRLQAENEKTQLRAKLHKQLSLILETRDTARGLIVNMSDVLFDTGKYTLKPGAREKLAKVSGILLAYPGLKIQVEGHTDSVGTDEYNQELSENRAQAVRDFLSQQGVAPDAITFRGFGETSPVASNDTAGGRQQNRRVELVVSGEIINNDLAFSIE